MARLERALGLVSEVVRNCRTASAELQQAFGEALAAITEAHTAAKRHNELVYHERVPAHATLPALEPKCIVKPMGPAELQSQSAADDDPFAKLVPLNVLQARG